MITCPCSLILSTLSDQIEFSSPLSDQLEYYSGRVAGRPGEVDNKANSAQQRWCWDELGNKHNILRETKGNLEQSFDLELLGNADV